MSSEQKTAPETRESYHYNGLLCWRIFYDDGNVTGERKTWYDSGRIFIREYFRNGFCEGKYRSWHPNGVPRECEFYQTGRPEGECKEWYDNGRLRRYRFYVGGKPGGGYEGSRNLIHQEFDINGVGIDLGFRKNMNIIPELKIGVSKLKELSRNHHIHLFDTVLIPDLARIVLQ